jgi:hypothetical protein
VFKKLLATKYVTRVLMFDPQIICATFHYVELNKPTEEIRVLPLKLKAIFAENYREI